MVGGSGFIGQAFALQSVHEGYSVSVLSKTQNQTKHKFREIEYIYADVTQYESLFQALSKRRFTHVANFSGYIDHSDFRNGGIDVINQHFDGVRNLVRCLHWECLECFLQIGSSDEYGNAASPQSESVKESPLSPYSFGKVAASHFLQMLNATEEFPSIVCRLFLVYGPGQKLDRFIPQIMTACLKNKHFPVTPGMHFRDFTYIEDIVDALLLTLKSNGAKGQVLNIGSGLPIRVRDVVEAIVGIAEGGHPQFGGINYRKGENMSLYSNSSNAQRILNWAPKIDLELGLNLTLEFYKNYIA